MQTSAKAKSGRGRKKGILKRQTEDSADSSVPTLKTGLQAASTTVTRGKLLLTLRHCAPMSASTSDERKSCLIHIVTLFRLLLTNQTSIHKEMKCRLKAGIKLIKIYILRLMSPSLLVINLCYTSVWHLEHVSVRVAL